MDTIFLLGSIQSLFLVILILAKKQRSVSDWILAVWLGHIGIHLLIYYLLNKELLHNSTLINLNSVLPLLQGPYLYFYVTSLVQQDFKFKLGHGLHLIPAIIFLFFIYFVLPGIASGEIRNMSIFEVSRSLTLLILFSVPFYIAWSLFRISEHKKKIKEYFSSIRGVDLSWLRYILVGMGCVWVIVIMVSLQALFGEPKPTHGSIHLVFLLLTVFIYAIGYIGIRQKDIFTDSFVAVSGNTSSSAEGKYKRSGLSPDELNHLAQKLKDRMETKKPYLDDELSLQTLSIQLDTTPNHLSQVINQGIGVSFYDYINQYRVKEFLSLRSDPSNDHLTILALALDSGFSSKSSFNRIFKKVTGTSPSQYSSD